MSPAKSAAAAHPEAASEPEHGQLDPRTASEQARAMARYCDGFTGEIINGFEVKNARQFLANALDHLYETAAMLGNMADRVATPIAEERRMSAAKHTPGPWHWTEADGYREEHPALMGPDASHICNFGCWTQFYPVDGTPPGDADARLIAAAPDLLEACQLLLRQVTGTDQPSAVNEARAAIAKATGAAA